jgi:hypothetical protein
VAVVVNYPPIPRVVVKNVFAEYPLRHSMDLVELGARSMDLVDLDFFGAGVFGKKKLEWSCFCGSGAAWSSPKHALNLWI